MTVFEVTIHGFADIVPESIERIGFGEDRGIHASGRVAPFFGIFNQTLEIGHMETLRIYTSQDPNYVISEMELRARVRATGKSFDTTLLERWQFRGGKVLSVKPHYFNAM